MTRPILLADRAPTSDIQLTRWVDEIAELTKPDHIEWCDGSYPEWERLTNLLSNWIGLPEFVIPGVHPVAARVQGFPVRLARGSRGRLGRRG
jgi:hypothetical protein